MTESPAHTGHRDWGIIAIAVFKLFKAALLTVVAVGAVRLLHRDVAETISHWAEALRVDQGNKFVDAAIETAFDVNDRQLKEISAGSFFYAALLLTEGLGLLAQRRWAEYLTVFITGSLIPLELYEIWQRVTALRIAILVINIAAVVYLIYRLRQDRKGDRHTA